MKFYINVLVLFFYSQLHHGQTMREYDVEKQARHAETKGYDPEYRVNYFENIILRTNFTAGVPRIEVLDGISEKVFDIRPAAEYQIGYSVDYKWFALGFAFTPKFLLNSDSREELSRSSSYAASLNFFFSDRWRQEFKYNYYKGFFSDSLEAGFGNTELHSIEGATYFIVNPNFSFRAHYAQTERQLKSAGSFIPRLNYLYSKTRPNIVNNFSLEPIDEINSLGVIAQIGYIHTFVVKSSWFVTLGLHSGLGYNYSEYMSVDSSSSSIIFQALTFALKSEISIGYNSYRWFFGANADFKNYNYSNIENDKFNRNTNYFNLYLGYRFNDNRPIRNFFGWFEDNLGF